VFSEIIKKHRLNNHEETSNSSLIDIDICSTSNYKKSFSEMGSPSLGVADAQVEEGGGINDWKLSNVKRLYNTSLNKSCSFYSFPLKKI